MRSAWDSTSCRAPVVPTRSSRNLAVAKGGWMTMTESIETAMVTWASTIFGNLHLGGFSWPYGSKSTLQKMTKWVIRAIRALKILMSPLTNSRTSGWDSKFLARMKISAVTILPQEGSFSFGCVSQHETSNSHVYWAPYDGTIYMVPGMFLLQARGAPEHSSERLWPLLNYRLHVIRLFGWPEIIKINCFPLNLKSPETCHSSHE